MTDAEALAKAESEWMMNGSPEFRAGFEAALALARAQSSWRPIETAPKDGAVIWGYAEPEGDPYGRSPLQAETYWDEDLEEWNRDGFTYWHKLTHWMPLPPKPAK